MWCIEKDVKGFIVAVLEDYIECGPLFLRIPDGNLYCVFLIDKKIYTKESIFRKKLLLCIVTIHWEGVETLISCYEVLYFHVKVHV